MHVSRWRPSRTCLIGVAGTVLLIASGLASLPGRSAEAGQSTTVGGGPGVGMQGTSNTQTQSAQFCGVKDTSSSTGGGCCTKEPQVCDYFKYTRSARCEGGCPERFFCLPSGSTADKELVYWLQDCWGDCSNPLPPVNSCTMDPDPDVSYAYLPTSCECVEVLPR